ncbi:MerR family transcriptional regulator [Arsukibacterium perlucidum]|uniref:MerR family transcriptional regulator n=1 Tax=Arsukibacterium perlucidum TaxID=368811 RepID=UPI0012F832E1|nr:MerR family transcriptional regulator [Arsukibacterium perlucidum]
MATHNTFSVSQVSQMAGVSIRTLHHYDNIGLLSPIRRQDNGYREYTEQHLARLHQILVYKQLEFSLDKIRDVMCSQHFDAYSALAEQRDVLLRKLDKTQLIINHIEVAMSIAQGEKNLDILFTGLPAEKTARWKSQFAEMASDQSDYKDVMQSLGNLTQQESEQFQQVLEHWLQEYLQVLSLPVHAEDVQQLVLEHLKLQNRFLRQMCKGEEFSGIGYQGYLTLADAIIQEPLAYELFAHYAPSLPEHLHEAMMYFAEHKFKGNIDKYRQVAVGSLSSE